MAPSVFVLLQVPFILGFALAWSLAAPPGPANAIIAHNAARHGFATGWWSGVGAVVGDVTMFLLMWFGVVRLIDRFPWLQVILGIIGAALMTRFAMEAWRSARNSRVLETSNHGGFARTYLLVITSPFNWAWWVTGGSALFVQLGLTTVLGFFAGLLAWVAFWSWLARAGATRMREFTKCVGYASSGVLALFALLVAWFAVQTMTSLLA